LIPSNVYFGWKLLYALLAAENYPEPVDHCESAVGIIVGSALVVSASVPDARWD
jgi:hypothetical protein